MNINGNTVFITGGSAGIGLEIARQFSKSGNRVIINGRNKERLEKAVNQLEDAYVIQGDLSDENERIRIATELKDHHPELNIVINNAGEVYYYSLDDISQHSAFNYAAREINTNYLAIIHFTELLLPLLQSSKEAAIVNVSSIAALRPSSALPTYSASKAALHFYTLSLRNSLAATTVKVFELMPPLVNTEFSAAIGGAENGIPAVDVATGLMQAISDERFEIPVGQTKQIHALLEQAFKDL